VDPVVLPPRRSNLHAHGERCMSSINEEALNRMIVRGEASLRSVIRTYLIHYHTERHHQGLGHHVITPEPNMGGPMGRVVRREHLGGVLSYDDREAA
jgi:Integrase core domain